MNKNIQLIVIHLLLFMGLKEWLLKVIYLLLFMRLEGLLLNLRRALSRHKSCGSSKGKSSKTRHAQSTTGS